jgi:DNA-binding YbaB/EbfC family protein
MANLMKLMKQAATMQKDIERIQKEVGEKVVEFSAAGGMVTVKARGDSTLVSIKIDPKIVDPNDVEMLEDAVKVAVDGALAAAREMMTTEMAKVTSGFNVPGLGGLA